MLDKLENANLITQDGKDWIKMALDPFHDFSMNIAGLPDATSGNTVMRMFKTKMTITRPASIPSTDRWDAHIFTLPLFDSLTLATRNIAVNNDISDGGAFDGSAQFGTVNVAAGPATGVWFDNATGLTSSSITQITPSLTTVRRSLARIVACGFEVHNDTPSLYKSGSVTCYDCPQGDYKPQIFLSPASTGAVAGLPYVASGAWLGLRRPPDNVSQAIQMPNSVTWEAEDGCYVVNKMDLANIDYQLPNNMPFVMTGQGGASSGAIPTTSYKELVTTWTSAATISADYYGSPPKYVGVVPINGDYCYRLTGMHTSGAYFNGLSPETVLTLEVHIVIESLPVNDPSETALATPTAEYDPMALQLYERSVRSLKAGVPASYNAKGDWWKMVGNTLLSVAPTVANAFVPGSGAFVSGVIQSGKKIKAQIDNKAKLYDNGNEFRQNQRQVVSIPKQVPMKKVTSQASITAQSTARKEKIRQLEREIANLRK